MLRTIKDLVLDLFSLIVDTIIRIVSTIYTWFMSQIIWERMIIIAFAAALAAVLMPVAQFYIIDFWYGVNNPLSINMIGLVMIMFVSIFFPYFLVYIVRITLNVLYMLHMLILIISNSLTQADTYSIAPGLFLNFMVPALFILFASLSYFNRRSF